MKIHKKGTIPIIGTKYEIKFDYEVDDTEKENEQLRKRNYCYMCKEKEGINELKTSLKPKIMVCDDCLRKIDQLFEESEEVTENDTCNNLIEHIDKIMITGGGKQ